MGGWKKVKEKHIKVIGRYNFIFVRAARCKRMTIQCPVLQEYDWFLSYDS